MDPTTFSEGTWTLQTYIAVFPESPAEKVRLGFVGKYIDPAGHWSLERWPPNEEYFRLHTCPGRLQWLHDDPAAAFGRNVALLVLWSLCAEWGAWSTKHTTKTHWKQTIFQPVRLLLSCVCNLIASYCLFVYLFVGWLVGFFCFFVVYCLCFCVLSARFVALAHQKSNQSTSNVKTNALLRPLRMFRIF